MLERLKKKQSNTICHLYIQMPIRPPDTITQVGWISKAFVPSWAKKKMMFYILTILCLLNL